MAKEYIPSVSERFSSPKLTVHIEDGVKFLERHKDEFDVVIVDSSDPIGKFSSKITLFYYYNSVLL